LELKRIGRREGGLTKKAIEAKLTFSVPLVELVNFMNKMARYQVATK
jgi:hypothetical protein